MESEGKPTRGSFAAEDCVLDLQLCSSYSFVLVVRPPQELREMGTLDAFGLKVQHLTQKLEIWRKAGEPDNLPLLCRVFKFNKKSKLSQQIADMQSLSSTRSYIKDF